MPEAPTTTYPAGFYDLDPADQHVIEAAADCEKTYRIVSLTEIYTQKKACAGYRSDFSRKIENNTSRVEAVENAKNQACGALKAAAWIIGSLGGIAGVATVVALIVRAITGKP